MPNKRSMSQQLKPTARQLVKSRLTRVMHIETNKPGAIRQTALLWAFIRAVQ